MAGLVQYDNNDLIVMLLTVSKNDHDRVTVLRNKRVKHGVRFRSEIKIDRFRLAIWFRSVINYT